jgi:hypothetical protein
MIHFWRHCYRAAPTLFTALIGALVGIAVTALFLFSYFLGHWLAMHNR